MATDRREYMREWRKRNRERLREYNREWAAKNPDYFRNWVKENREAVLEANRRAARKHRLRRNADKRLRRYGVSPEQFEEMLRRQAEVCAICGQPETRVIKGTVSSLCVDHCHKTGRVRELLCHRCNRALGFWNDDPAMFEAAARYLRKHAP